MTSETPNAIAARPATPVFRGRPFRGCRDCSGTGLFAGIIRGRERWDVCECVEPEARQYRRGA